jgi:hypothetical protein
MAELRTANYAVTAVNGDVGLTDTTITLTDASILPSLPTAGDFTYLTLVRQLDDAIEIVQVDDIVGNDITVQRGADGTVPLAFTSGDAAHMFFTSGMIDYLKSISGTFNPGLTKYQSIYEIGGTTHTVTDAQSAGILRFTSASPVTVTIPAGLTTGWMGAFEQAGVGQVTIVADVGVTFSDSGTVATVKQGSLISGLHTGADGWNFAGEMVSAPIIGSIETADRTLTITSGMTYDEIQAKYNEVGGYIQTGVAVTVEIENGTYDIGANAIKYPDFGGGGIMITKAINATGPNTAVKNVTFRGTGANIFSNIPPYNSTLEDERVLGIVSNANLIIFGDIGFELIGATSTVTNAAIYCGFSQTSFEHCYFKNDAGIGSGTWGVVVRNKGVLNTNGCHYDITEGTATNSAAVANIGAATGGLSNSSSGTGGKYAYYAANASKIAHAGSTILFTVQEDLTANGGEIN